MSEFQKFLFEGLPVRGVAVRLTDGWRDMQARRSEPLPEAVTTLLGEMSACALLLQGNLKFQGALVLQMAGDGPVKLAVAEARTELTYRATATVTAAVPRLDSQGQFDLADLLNVHGGGRCAITLDADDRPSGVPPYQGVVPLNDEQAARFSRLAQAVEQYMRLSEQLDTKIVLAADAHSAAGLMIQRMPLSGEGNLEGHLGAERAAELEDAFPRLAMKVETLKSEELLGLPIQEVLHRLFWEEPLRVFEPATPRFACTCSRERVGRMLVGLGREEIESILAERADVEIACNFCGHPYRFDAVDCAQLFQTGGGVSAAPSGLQ
ncbi:Hsp33 family molecular chaperone HslO [Inhella gelatinilytica]|uniref:Hsp33 family molecular chaperone HslO n=1 Tax=Inhella gelatinilytica TaxID=2795030 RepID=A0A931IVF7_9BURK|nr:Hsp33 family molecular chaperone HslO [Inhella gelatinilytica]MBH9552894.1 Hsp33 family molecular chaperone HslO [Inhella gelatinilytica]